MATINDIEAGSGLSEIAQSVANLFRQSIRGDTIKIEIKPGEEKFLKRKSQNNFIYALSQLGIARNSFSMGSPVNGKILMKVIF